MDKAHKVDTLSLLLSRCRCLESNIISGRIKLEDLRATFGVDTNQDHR